MPSDASEHEATQPQEIDVEALRAGVEGPSAPIILDVRSRAEFRAGRIPGAVNVPFWRLAFGPGPLAAARHQLIVVYCGHGPRAHIAAAALRSHGFGRVACLRGHMAEWEKRGLPQERG